MKGMIFAAGEGKRLRPLTLNTPKALVPVKGIPMLERVIVRMREAGINDIVVNVYHLADQIKNFLKANDFGIPIHISDETNCLLDTGGGLLKAKDLLGTQEPVLVHNADVVTDVNLRAMIDSHTSGGSDVTILVQDRLSSRKLLFDSEMRLVMREPKGNIPLHKSNLTPYAFNCVHVIEPAVLSRLPSYPVKPVFSIIDFYLNDAVLPPMKVKGYVSPISYQWFDIGTPEKLASANKLIKI